MKNTILNKKEIVKFNQNILAKTNTLCKLKYIKDKSAIVITRSNLKNRNNLTQETELHIGEICNVLEEIDSYYLIKTKFYTGLIKRDDIALFNNINEYNFFNDNNFIIVIEPLLHIKNVLLDMSTTLPYLDKNYIVLPKVYNNYLEYELLKIDSKYIYKGYPDFTKDNLHSLLLSYLGIAYSWGGEHYGVDCSSFIKNVLGVFGIMVPRNSQEQRKSIGKIINVKNKSNEDKLLLINGIDVPILLYTNKHVMFYFKDNLVIHASSKYEKVVISKLSEYINDIISINKIQLES